MNNKEMNGNRQTMVINRRVLYMVIQHFVMQSMLCLSNQISTKKLLNVCSD